MSSQPTREKKCLRGHAHGTVPAAHTARKGAARSSSPPSSSTALRVIRAQPFVFARRQAMAAVPCQESMSPAVSSEVAGSMRWIEGNSEAEEMQAGVAQQRARKVREAALPPAAAAAGRAAPNAQRATRNIEEPRSAARFVASRCGAVKV